MAAQKKDCGISGSRARVPLHLVLLWLCSLLGALAAPAKDDSRRDPHRGVHMQIPAAEFPVQWYPYASSIGLAVAVVPDPLVPRYRRLYDLSVRAIELGMLKDNYVLDRYSFPWSQELQQDGALVGPAATPGNPTPVAAAAPTNANRSAYGLMVFRCDAWRGDVCGFPEQVKPGEPQAIEKRAKTSAGTQLRVLYIVTDTATQGVATHQLRCAMERILQQVPRPGNPQSEQLGSESGCPNYDATPPPSSTHSPAISLLAYPDSQCPNPGPRPSVVVLGPNFSGAMDSVGEAMSGLPEFENSHICLVSSSTTDTTNERLSARYHNVSYRRLALSDRSKIAHIARLAQRAGLI